MQLSIITLNYKTPQKTLACVASVHQQYKKYFNEGKMELIIVDNGSDDASSQIIQKVLKENTRKGIRFFQNKVNEGFGGGCNFGVRHAKGEIILFLNSDTKVLNKGLLDMVSFLETNTSVGIIGGQMKNPDGTTQTSAAKFYSLFTILLLLFGFERFGIFKNRSLKMQKVDWVTGACFMIKKDLFDRLCGFDTNIFMYTEDMELCFRAKKLGFLTYFYPDIQIIHSVHGSSNRSFAIINIYKGILYFYKKHKPLWQYTFVKILLKVKAIILVIIGRVTGNLYLYKTYEKALAIS